MASRSSRPPSAYVGISGYNYPSWRGAFYPHTLRLADWLRYASRTFNSIELNGTFYSLKSPDVFRRWYDETPPGFRFAIKGSRFITHNLKLKRAEVALANFFASGILALEEKTGPFLWQLPATYRFDRERIESFMRLAPRDSCEAARIAAGHDERLRRGALIECAHAIPYRHALEVRHPSYFVPELYDLLAEHGWSFVIADTAEVFPYAEEVTADFVYVRLHGSRQLYASDYSDGELDRWAARLRGWMGGTPPRDVYVYFDNDMHAHAPRDARRLAERLGCAPPLGEAIALAGASRSRSASSSPGSKARTG